MGTTNGNEPLGLAAPPEQDIVRIRLTRRQMETMEWLEGIHAYGPGQRPTRSDTTWAGSRWVVEDFSEELRAYTRGWTPEDSWGAEVRREKRTQIALLRKLEGILTTSGSD